MAIAGLMARFLGAVKVGRLYLSHRKALTAHASGGQTNATLLDRAINNVSTVATTADSVKLPKLVESLVVIAFNTGSNSMTVYSNEATGVSINGTAGATGISIASGHSAMFAAVDASNWRTVPSSP